MRMMRTMAIGAISLALAAGTATAQQQYGQKHDQQHGQQWNQEQRGQQQSDQQRFGQQQSGQQFGTRGFEQGGERWRTTTQIPQLRGVELTLAQIGDEHETFLRVEDGEIVSAYVDGRPVSQRNVQVRGNQVRVLDEDREPAAIFRLPQPGRLMASPEGRWDRDGFDQPRWQQEQFRHDFDRREPQFDRQMDRQRHRQFEPYGMRDMQRGRMLGTPEAPVADLRTSAVGILMFEAQPQHLRDTGYRTGIFVDAVQERMPAHLAGIRRGDIIVAVEGREDITPERLKTFLRQVSPGERLSFTVVRDQEEREVNVRPTAMLPAKANWDYMQTGLDDRQLRRQQMMVERQRQMRGFREGRLFGIGLTEADQEELKELEQYEEGLEITRINPGTIFHETGFRRGDIIVAVEGDADITRNDLREILQDKEPGDTVRMQVLRDGQLHTVNVPIGRTGRGGW